jgi:RimJ/RimL family protein N-acetyltransferase
MIVLETDRILVKTFEKTDFRNFLSLNQNKELMQYFDDGVKTLEKLNERFREILEHQDKHGFSYYNLFLKKTGEYIGQCGPYYNYDMSINICYGLLKKFHAQGYMSESLTAIFDFLFKKYDFKELIIRSSIYNIPSINLAKNLGGTFWKNATSATGFEVIYFIIEKENFYKKMPSLKNN